MEGVSADRFGPRAKLTRAMLAQVLYNLEGRPAVGESGFRDVAGDKWYAPAVAWAMETGLVDGLGDGLFGPDICVSREQAVSILYRYAKYKGRELTGPDDLKRFSDAASRAAGQHNPECKFQWRELPVRTGNSRH